MYVRPLGALSTLTYTLALLPEASLTEWVCSNFVIGPTKATFGVISAPLIAIWLLTDVSFKVSKFIATEPLSPLLPPEAVI